MNETYKYKVYELKEDGEVGRVIDITNDREKWEEKFFNFEVMIVAPFGGVKVA